eukprot:gene18257-21849_t
MSTNYLYVLIVLVSLAYVTSSSPVFTASPDVLSTSGDIVELKWSGLSKPSEKDLIAIYYPPNAKVTEPIGFIQMTDSPTWKQGYGTVSVPLVNVRDTYIFRMWVPGILVPLIKSPYYKDSFLTQAATSNSVSFASPNAPGKAYLALTNNTSEMRLMWISGTDDTPTVQYGLSPSSLTSTATGITVTYGINEMCASPANDPTYFRNPGFIHDVVMTGLSPSTQYYYTFGSNSSGYTEATYSFVSAPTIGTEAYVIAFGDLGLNADGFDLNAEIQYPARSTVANIFTTITSPFNTSPLARRVGATSANGDNTSPPWSVLHIGDISYARGNAFIWDYFHDMIEEVSSRAPWMVSIGNHEWDYTKQSFRPSWSNYGTDSGGECGVPFNNRYHMTGEEGPARNLWFSYDYGPIHFVQMSAEHDFLIGSPQNDWIENDLKNVDRSVTPFVVFSGHRPMYCSTDQAGEAPMYAHLRENIEPLLIKYNVSLCFWAHVHVYERICGMNNGTCAASDNDAPVHIVIGMSGNTSGEPWQSEDGDKNGWGHFAQPEWSQFRTVNFGYTRFYANQTHLYFEYVGNQGNTVHDHFWLESRYA